uniref:Calcineurin-like phosphoesterase domain-containing protein n=1 Tax=Odontella aurita TaxID=265563 RepID=A0A7S4JYK5_9STRA|mmetsp:Transcript_57341/g.171011  ORF Transcript_57341/g.171011 Transcript_57341/m.171011 type:complete len:472 (+) Transcript_57341:103-1518(+)
MHVVRPSRQPGLVILLRGLLSLTLLGLVSGFVVRPTLLRGLKGTRTPLRHLVPEAKSYLDAPIDDDAYEECLLLDGDWSHCQQSLPLSELVTLEEDRYELAASPDVIPSLQEGQRLICVGDVHGDIQALRECLHLAGLIDKEQAATSMNNGGTPLWTGGNTIVVQTGDVLDRGFSELDCFSLLASLSRQAQDEGGHVILLYGNHESLNAMGLFKYATDDAEYEQHMASVVDEQLNTRRWRVQYVKNQPARWATYEPGGLLARPLLANMKVAVQVGKTVCVHAGLKKEHLDEYGGIESMNQQAHQWITTRFDNVTYNNVANYESPADFWKNAEARQVTYLSTVPPFLGGGVGSSTPVWMRDYSRPHDAPPRDPNAQSKLEATLKALDCDRMAMGHTPQLGINSVLCGKAWRIDVGMSQGVMSGKPEALEVQFINGTEEVTVLTRDERIPGQERELYCMLDMMDLLDENHATA